MILTLMEFACNITCYILNKKCDENIIIFNNNKKKIAIHLSD